MPRYVAFLGGINVGGHRVSMTALKDLFAELGFDDVATYIASGNVVFSTRKKTLEPPIEKHLQRALGYSVPTFVRTDAQVIALAGASPFGEVTGTVGIGLLREAPPADVVRAVNALRSDSDTLQVVGTELWWHLPNGFSGSQLPPNALAKAGLPPLTTRNLNTMQKLAAKLS
jgi:uncharacterized protein (DUF1697 family)